MNTIEISRRRFAQLLGAGAACAIARPALSLARTPPAKPVAPPSTGMVRLSANENPFGPSQVALRSMTEAFNQACRYPDDHNNLLIETLAKINGVQHDQILLGDGSSEILKLCADTFTGPRESGGPLVVADPTFEAVLQHAKVNGAEVIKVPLTAAFGHDLEKMGAAAKGGLIYVCNPNNPTASITPKNELRDFIGKLPRETTLLVDEAYFHYVDTPDYDSVIPLVNDHPNLIVARTFSKIYGMAGLRCGYCVGQREMIDRMRPHQSWDSINIMALAAAVASLNDVDQVTTGRKRNIETRGFLTSELNRMGYQLIPSQANFVMIDVKRPVVPLIQAFKEHGVEVGRLFPALPNHMRVTIGKKTEMDAFLSAFRKTIA